MLQNKDELSALLDKLESVIQSTEIYEPNPKFLESVATKSILLWKQPELYHMQQPTELPQREAESLSPARFKEISAAAVIHVYMERDPFK